MLITTLHVNLTSYVLDQSVPLDDLAHSIEEAARTGGSFVPVRTSDGVERSVLITPAVVVELEPLEVADDAFEGEAHENNVASQSDSSQPRWPSDSPRPASESELKWAMEFALPSSSVSRWRLEARRPS